MSAPAVLTPELLERLAQLRVRAQGVVEGVLTGQHRSPHQGQSVEFAEHKEYAPGDEIRHIDWKAYGKFDRYYVKRFEQETNLRAFVLVDGSKSMAFTSGGPSKLEVARTLAASLAHLLLRQQDAIGLYVLGHGDAGFLPPRASPGHLQAVLDTLVRLEPKGDADLAKATDFLAERAGKRSLFFLISDLFEAEGSEGFARYLQLRAARHDVSVLHVLDRAELDFPYEEPTQFLGMEDDRSLQAHASEIRESYLEEFGAFLKRSEAACAASRTAYVRVPTDGPLDRALASLLQGRGARR